MAKQRLPREQRRQQIAETALILLAEAGPRGLTLAELGDRIGVTDASILRHFDDKAAVIDAAIAHFRRLLEDDLVRDVEDPLRRLAAFFSRRLAKVQQRPEIIRLAYSDRLRDVAGVSGAAHVDECVRRSVAFVRDCIERAQEEGMVSNETPAQVWVWVVIGVLRGAAGVTQNPAEGAFSERMSPERAWELLEQILTAGAPS